MTVHLLVELLILIGEAKNPEDLNQRFDGLLNAYKFDFHRLTLQPSVHGGKEVVLAARWPKGWAEIYRLRKYATVDPGAKLLMVAQRPYRLRDAVFLMRNEPHRTRVQRMIQDAARHGLNDGYVFPVHGRTGLIGSLLISGKAVDLSPAEIALFQAVATSTLWRHLEFRGWAADLEKVGAVEVPLTKREIEVVSRLAEGLTSIEIAKELQISNHTVDWYINGLQDKMKAKNRQHVVAQAFRRGLVS